MQNNKISKKKAKNKKIEYSEPITVHQSNKTRIDFIAFYIPRSEGPEMNIKLQKYVKKDDGWVEDQGLSFKETSIRMVVENIKKHFSVLGHKEIGDFLAIKLDDNSSNLKDINTHQGINAILRILQEKDILKHFKSNALDKSLLKGFRVAIRVQEIEKALIDLESYLDTGVKDEKIY